MKVRGAYMAIKEFIYTYKKGVVYTERGNDRQDSWSLEPGRKLIIPDYQREYRWEEKQLTELMDDISKGNCYLGQIAVAQNVSEPNNYYLVDGQQRITSIIILLTVLCRQFYQSTDNINIERFELHDASNNNDNAASPRLCFEANCFDDFQTFIMQIYHLQSDNDGNFNVQDFSSPTKDSYRQEERYINACSVFNRIIREQLKLKLLLPQKLSYIKELILKILETQVSVVIFEGDSSYESEKVFLDINEKGLRLDNEDILKAYYFQSISSDRGKEALNTWTLLKEAYFNLHSTLRSNKIPLETFVNYSLQTDLLMRDSAWNYSKFDDDLRYKGPDGKKHICQLFTDTDLHTSIKLVANFFTDINSLLDKDSNSTFYIDYLKGRNATTREIFKLLFNSICRSDMKIIYIALIKMWWLRKRSSQDLSFEDIIQLFSFYIISNVSGLKKEKLLFSNDFISAQAVETTYSNLYIIEIQMLKEAFSKATTLKRDQEKAEFLSFNIQMFYNDFRFNKEKSCWEISISNQEFLAKYSSNRDKYTKDHFLIQNGKTIQLYDGNNFTVTQSMALLRKRAYNFIYHEDTFGNVDFVTRLNIINSSREGTEQQNSKYGKYENDYFDFVEEHLQLFFKANNGLPSWGEVLEKYQDGLPEIFPRIISFILEEHSYTWNHRVCKHFENQFSSQLQSLAENS